MDRNAVLMTCIVLLASYASMAQSNKGYGNDIIVNIGQGNGDNVGPGTGVKKGGGGGTTPATAKSTQTLCTSDQQTVEVEADLVEAYLKQGGKLGSCPPATTSPPPDTPTSPPPTSLNLTKAPPTSVEIRNDTKTPPDAPLPQNNTTPLPDVHLPQNNTKSPRKSKNPQRATKAPKKKATITPSPTTPAPTTSDAKAVHVPICLPHVLTNIKVPVESLGEFLEKGATLGACPSKETAPPVTNGPVIVPTPAPPVPAIVQQRQTVEIVQDEECDVPVPYGYSSASNPDGPRPSAGLRSMPIPAGTAPPLLRPASVPRISRP